jgi:hypothetical protein
MLNCSEYFKQQNTPWQKSSNANNSDPAEKNHGGPTTFYEEGTLPFYNFLCELENPTGVSLCVFVEFKFEPV